MHALVSYIAVAGVPKPVPVVGEAVLAVGTHRGRTEEDIPIQAGRNWLFGRVADRLPASEAESARHVERSDRALAEHGHRLALVPDGAALGADLHHALVLAGRLDHLLALEYVVAGWLLHVDVLAGLAGPDGGERVPVIGRCYRDRVDVPVFKQLAHVRVFFRRAVLKLPHHGRGAFPRRLVDIADRCDSCTLHFGEEAEVATPAAACADDGQIDRLVGP